MENKKILFLPNWKVKSLNDIPNDLQAPDYLCEKEKYWFFKYFKNEVDIDIIDISANNFIEKLEKKIHFYPWQSIKAYFKKNKYDYIISHGMPSGIMFALLRRIFRKGKCKHIVFDIGAFNSASTKGNALRLSQFASKSIDGIIVHESEQLKYYNEYFPWLKRKSKFIHFGTDVEYFEKDIINENNIDDYILSIGYNKRDNETLIRAFEGIDTKTKLLIIGPGNQVISNNIEIRKNIPKRELNEYIQKAKFCILPLKNYNYSFGQMTLLQQMFYKKIIIVADVPSMRDYVRNMDTAILYESENVNDLREKIEKVLQNPSQYKHIEENAKKSVVQEFNEKIMANNIEKFIINI